MKTEVRYFESELDAKRTALQPDDLVMYRDGESMVVGKCIHPPTTVEDIHVKVINGNYILKLKAAS